MASVKGLTNTNTQLGLDITKLELEKTALGKKAATSEAGRLASEKTLKKTLVTLGQKKALLIASELKVKTLEDEQVLNKATITKLTNENIKLKATVERQKIELDKKDVEIEKLKKKQVELVTENKELKATADKWEAKAVKTKVKLTAARVEIEKLETTNKDLNKALEKEKKERGEVEGLLTDLRKDYKELEETHAETLEEKEQLEKDKIALGKQITAEEGKVTALKKELVDKKEDYRVALAAKDKTINAQIVQIGDLEVELDKETKRANAAEATNKGLKLTVELQKATVIRVEKQRDKALGDIASRDKQLLDMQEARRQLEADQKEVVSKQARQIAYYQKYVKAKTDKQRDALARQYADVVDMDFTRELNALNRKLDQNQRKEDAMKAAMEKLKKKRDDLQAKLAKENQAYARKVDMVVRNADQMAQRSRGYLRLKEGVQQLRQIASQREMSYHNEADRMRSQTVDGLIQDEVDAETIRRLAEE